MREELEYLSLISTFLFHRILATFNLIVNRPWRVVDYNLGVPMSEVGLSPPRVNTYVCTR